jgi:iron complex transport system ATP-binding protein
MIKANQLEIGYRKGKNFHSVQKNLGFYVGKGEFIAILGPNGCGKSTLLKTLGGLIEPVSGLLQMNGKNIEDIPLTERAKLFSIVLTDIVQIGYMTVYQMVSMGRHPYTTLSGKLGKKDEIIVREALDSVNMGSFAENQFHELSDGERQRVMVAKALAQTTPLILLDEPTSHLDLPNRIETMLLLKALSRETGKTILISTHEIDLAMQLADKIWLMEKGKGIFSGIPKELIDKGELQSVFHSDNFGFDDETGRVIIF